MDHLIVNFHALEGDTLREKRKSFNRLLKRIEQELTGDEDLNAFVAGLIPQTRLEEILRVEILLRFQRNDALLEVLKSGNVVLIRKVLNCWRFFETAFDDIDAETLVNEVFLRTSFSTRMKTITKLAANVKSETLADSYFEAIKEKYGLHVASAILPACSLNLLKSTIETFKVKLSDRQLLKIFRKHQEFLVYYFDVLFKDKKLKLYEYTTVLKHVARVNAEIFWQIHEKYEFDVKFGRHMTSYMIADERGKKYVAKNFNLKKAYAIMKHDERKLREYLSKLYPKNIQDFYPLYSRSYDNVLTKFLRYVPWTRRYALVNACFSEMYGENLTEHDIDAISDNLLEIMPVEERKKIVDQKVLKDESRMYMWPAEEAIAAIKERIKYTTDKDQREHLVLQLYKTCSFNRDEGALLNVLKYVRNRCRSHETLIKSFLNQLDGWNHLERLSAEHWTHIHELIKPLMANSRFYNDFYFLAAYFRRKMDADDLNDECLNFVVKKIIERKSFYYLVQEQKNFGREGLERMAVLIPKMFEGDEYQEATVWILMNIVLHNNHNSRNRIPLSNYPNFVQVAKSYLTREHCYEATAIIKYCVQYEHDADDDYDCLFWKYYEKLFDANILLWYMRNKPLRVFENVDEILKHTSSHVLTYRLGAIFKFFSMHASYGATEKIIDFAKNSLKADSVYTVGFAIKALLHLTVPQSFLESMSFLCPPEDGKIDYIQAEKKQLEIQELYVKSLMDIQNPSLCLPALLMFCKSDYLKYAYRPLYYISTHVPETDCDRLVEALCNSAVSVRKHAVCLVTLVCPKEKIYGFLKQVAELDNHATMRKVIYQNTLKYFLGDQSQIFWDLLQLNIKRIDKDDAEAYERLTSLEKIPSAYLPQYIQLAYEVLAQHESKQIQNKKSDLLNRIPDDVIKDLSNEFLKKIIVETMFSKNDFWLSFVFCTTGQNQEEILLFCFDLFKAHYNRCLPSDTGSNFSKELLRNVDDFVSGFCLRAVTSDAGEKLMRKFVELWSETMTGKLFDEQLLQLQLAENFLACRSEDKPSEFADKVNVLLVHWIGECGDASVVHLFADKLSRVMLSAMKWWQNSEESMKFLEKLCSADNLPHNCNYIVALKLLPTQEKFKTHFDGLIVRLRECSVPNVRIRFGQLLKSLAA